MVLGKQVALEIYMKKKNTNYEIYQQEENKC